MSDRGRDPGAWHWLGQLVARGPLPGELVRLRLKERLHKAAQKQITIDKAKYKVRGRVQENVPALVGYGHDGGAEKHKAAVDREPRLDRAREKPEPHRHENQQNRSHQA